MRALLIDHDDSFTENLRHWLTPVFSQIDLISYTNLSEFSDVSIYDLIVFSPGPKSPSDYAQSLQFLNGLTSSQNVLGVCLGMQMMVEIEGGTIEPYAPPIHGKSSQLNILQHEFDHFQNRVVGRYHSLKCNPTQCFQVIAESTEDQIPMWIIHTKNKWVGWQFHPESFLTAEPEILQQWLFAWITST